MGCLVEDPGDVRAEVSAFGEDHPPSFDLTGKGELGFRGQAEEEFALPTHPGNAGTI